ncbi:nicotinate (nicotinamide) nucleotide adenylyltransferase [Mycoplasmatota bacterium]|nr:nicotinate (nicotinamide) nucleotide adenylyltransferase [Mycoplasmatota bacterium]
MIILYGGSFNPPTIAHFEISKYLINKYQPHRFIFIPVGNNYNKANLIPFIYRYQMLQILASKLNNTVVSEYENKENFEGTIQTLNHFQSIFKDEPLFYVIGADNLLSITKWINYQTLLSSFKFIVLNRDGLDIKDIFERNDGLNKFKNSFIIENDFKQMNLSSSQYRNLTSDAVVLNEINDYIYKHQLYTRGEKV